jgi:hypothetical protein
MVRWRVLLLLLAAVLAPTCPQQTELAEWKCAGSALRARFDAAVQRQQQHINVWTSFVHVLSSTPSCPHTD